MRIAIIGGGASGLATAWLLDRDHEITLFEREPVLGGHVRTLGGNVPSSLPDGVRLDAGVIEFDRHNFPLFHAWMAELGVAVASLAEGGTSTLFLADGRHLRTPSELSAEHLPLGEHLVELGRLVPLALRWRRFLWNARVPRETLHGLPIERFLHGDELSTWIRCLLMYAYSVPYEEVPRVSAEMAVPMLRDFLRPNAWTHMPQGVSSYVDRVVGSLRGKVVLDARLSGIARPSQAGGVLRPEVIHADGSREPFDAIVVAIPPHRVLELLSDPSEEERSWFAGYGGGFVETVVHTDTSLYARRGAHAYSEFDLFELPTGGHGYNAYLNRLASLPESEPHYSLAFDLDEEIDTRKVLHRQRHDVARYTAAALAARDDLGRRNGQRQTYFAGAFLGNGLHEGAVRSALEVAARLGGRTLAGFRPGPIG